MAKSTAKDSGAQATAAPRRSARDSSIKSTNESLKLAEKTAKGKDSRKRDDHVPAGSGEKEERESKKQKKSDKEKAATKNKQESSDGDELSEADEKSSKAASQKSKKADKKPARRGSGKKEEAPETKSKKKEEPKEEANDEQSTSIPSVVLEDEDGNDVNLLEISKKRVVVLFAYPKASTPGCTKQAKEYSAAYDDNFANDDGPAVYGISGDSVKAQKSFKEKNNLQYHILSDPSHKLIKALGASKGSGVTRSFFILKDGEVKHSRIKVSPNTTADALEELKKLL